MAKNEITVYQNNQNRRGAGNKPDGFTRRFIIKEGDTAKLAEAVKYDNCPGFYKGGYRSGDNFSKADCVLGDIDNSHSDNPADWKTHDDVKKALTNVSFYFYPSRNNMLEKDGKAPRPKEHFIFPIDETMSADEYVGYMKWLIEAFPELHFDEKVKSAAQLNFGVENPQVSYVGGEEA